MSSRRSFLARIGALTAATAAYALPHSLFGNTPLMHSDLQPPVPAAPAPDAGVRLCEEARGDGLIIALGLLHQADNELIAAIWTEGPEYGVSGTRFWVRHYLQEFQRYAPLTTMANGHYGGYIAEGLTLFGKPIAQFAPWVRYGQDLHQGVNPDTGKPVYIAGVVEITVGDDMDYVGATHLYLPHRSADRLACVEHLQRLLPQMRSPEGVRRLITSLGGCASKLS